MRNARHEGTYPFISIAHAGCRLWSGYETKVRNLTLYSIQRDVKPAIFNFFNPTDANEHELEQLRTLKFQIVNGSPAKQPA
jgi:hypothetical protein